MVVYIKELINKAKASLRFGHYAQGFDEQAMLIVTINSVF